MFICVSLYILYVTQLAKPKRLYVVDQVFNILDDNAAATANTTRQKPNLNIDDLQQKRKTTIILSRTNIERIANLGRKGETYDNIINRMIDHDIVLSRK